MSANLSKPTLNDARARVARASEHIINLEHKLTPVSPQNLQIPDLQVVAGTLVVTRYVYAGPEISILIGEVVYNLRAALDYLVYELFYLDTGKTKNTTKFLIEDSKQAWDSHFPDPGMSAKQRSRLWLHLLTPAHQAALKRLQPVFGCKWSAALRDLSNPDKHRRLVRALARETLTGSDAMTVRGPVMVNFNVTVEVKFEDASLVVETLKLMHEKVADVIEVFDPDFQ